MVKLYTRPMPRCRKANLHRRRNVRRNVRRVSCLVHHILAPIYEAPSRLGFDTVN